MTVGLGLGPPVRGVGLDLLGTGLGLDPVEGVEGGDQRQVELVLDQVPGDAAQPVVGVHGVEGEVLGGPEALGGAHALEDPVGELLDHRGQRLFGHRRGRAGRDVVDAEAGLDVHGGGKVVGPGPGEHVTLDPGPGQRGRELADVDVHAAAVPGARLGQGRGVQRKDGQTPHAPPILPGGSDQPTAAAGPLPPGMEAVPSGPTAATSASSVDSPSPWSPRRTPGGPPPGRRSRDGTRGRCASSPGAAPRSGGGRRRCGGRDRCRRPACSRMPACT